MTDLDSILIYEQYVSLLNEMPYNHGWSSNGRMENPEQNRQEVKNIKASKYYKKIGKFKEYDIYEINLNFGRKFLNLIKGDKTYAYYSYRTLDNGFIQTRQMYQLKSERGLMRDFFTNWILPKFGGVVSDDTLSEEAMNFWVKIINELKYKIEFGIYHDNQFFELENSEELREFHKEDPEFNNYMFYIKLV
jgi:hypothetical protein